MLQARVGSIIRVYAGSSVETRGAIAAAVGDLLPYQA